MASWCSQPGSMRWWVVARRCIKAASAGLGGSPWLCRSLRQVWFAGGGRRLRACLAPGLRFTYITPPILAALHGCSPLPFLRTSAPQVLTRFLVLGVHIFVPVAAVCCAVREWAQPFDACRPSCCVQGAARCPFCPPPSLSTPGNPALPAASSPPAAPPPHPPHHPHPPPPCPHPPSAINRSLLRAVIPLCMTGTVVDNAQFASTEEIMRYTLSNIQQGSSKLW